MRGVLDLSIDVFQLDELQVKLGYTFKDPEYLITALSHSSYTNERSHMEHSNERFEFLGDSLLGMMIAELIFHKKPEMAEGKMTKLRADLVCESNLAALALELDLGSYILLGRGELVGGKRDRPSLLADAFEAILAAIYLDGGYEPLKLFIEKTFIAMINKPVPRFVDYKTQLQEFIQLKPGQKIVYILINEQGPDHSKHFTTELYINGKPISTGTGRSKKTAEQEAAKAALEILS